METKLDPRDLKMSLFVNGSEHQAMTIRHLPTGAEVQGRGSSHDKLRQELLNKLEQLVLGPVMFYGSQSLSGEEVKTLTGAYNGLKLLREQIKTEDALIEPFRKDMANHRRNLDLLINYLKTGKIEYSIPEVVPKVRLPRVNVTDKRMQGFELKITEEPGGQEDRFDLWKNARPYGMFTYMVEEVEVIGLLPDSLVLCREKWFDARWTEVKNLEVIR